MKKILHRFLLIALCLPSALSYAEEQAPANKMAIAAPDFYFSSDSESFSTYKYKAGILPIYEHGEKYTGITYQHNYYTQGNWSSTGEQYTLLTKAINPRTALGYNLNIGYNTENGHQLMTTDSNYGFRVTDTTKAEVMVNRDRVETQNSLNNGIYYTMGGASIEQQLGERFTVVAMGANMYFSDTNTRPIARVKLIYDLLPAYGLTAQLRYRQYWDTNTNVPNNYFNPNQYIENMLAFGARKRLSGWMLSGTAGVGRQSVNQAPSTTTQLYEIAAVSPVASDDYYFKTRAGYGKSAGFLGPNYFYRYVMEELIIPF